MRCTVMSAIYGRYVPLQRVGVFEPLWSENGYRLCPYILVWNWVWFSRELRECNFERIYRFNSK